MAAIASTPRIPCTTKHTARPVAAPSDAFGHFTAVTVGPKNDQKRFHVYHGLMCHHSNVFAGMINNNGASSSSSLVLNKVDVEVFSVFFTWMTTNTINVPVDQSYNSPGWFMLIRVFLFAEEYRIVALRNDIIDAFFEKLVQIWVFPMPFITELYDMTEQGCTLRDLVVDICADNMGFGDFPRESEYYPAKFLADVLARFLATDEAPRRVHVERDESHSWVTWKRGYLCTEYHVHGCDDLDKKVLAFPENESG
ncbi:hypothetical protein BDV95DRAFT_121927 [Massariosphaeria phaeospora]|uniref:BTB domain-containing protein n=1 Tax=Massariosphaeria phaeospora TaxID=100035 RepID=A0A7C8M8G8_9PLEO|nr:hypothetical protein BDV95DRAFT_121927 [Massariosphaeria phaeospora]